MRLRDWIELERLTPHTVGHMIGLKHPSDIYRFLSGRRVPRPKIMEAIWRETGGAVTPNDFHPFTAEPLPAPRSWHGRAAAALTQRTG